MKPYRLVREMTEARKTAREIAQAVGLSPETVRAYRRALGLRLRRPRGTGAEEAARHREAGLSVSQTAEVMGVKVNTVKFFLRQFRNKSGQKGKAAG